MKTSIFRVGPKEDKHYNKFHATLEQFTLVWSWTHSEKWGFCHVTFKKKPFLIYFSGADSSFFQRKMNIYINEMVPEIGFLVTLVIIGLYGSLRMVN